MNPLFISVLSIASAGYFRLNVKGEQELDGANVTIGSNFALTISNGANMNFWLEQGDNFDNGRSSVNGMLYLDTVHGFVGARGVTSLLTGAIIISPEGEFTFGHVSHFWVCPDQNSDIAFGAVSPCKCIPVNITATPMSNEEAQEENSSYSSSIASLSSIGYNTDDNVLCGPTVAPLNGTSTTMNSNVSAVSTFSSSSPASNSTSTLDSSTLGSSASVSSSSTSTSSSHSETSASSNIGLVMVPSVLCAVFGLLV